MQVLPKCLPSGQDYALFLKLSSLLSGTPLSQTPSNTASVTLAWLRQHHHALNLLLHLWLQVRAWSWWCHLPSLPAACLRSMLAIW